MFGTMPLSEMLHLISRFSFAPNVESNLKGYSLAESSLWQFESCISDFSKMSPPMELKGCRGNIHKAQTLLTNFSSSPSPNLMLPNIQKFSALVGEKIIKNFFPHFSVLCFVHSFVSYINLLQCSRVGYALKCM